MDNNIDMIAIILARSYKTIAIICNIALGNASNILSNINPICFSNFSLNHFSIGDVFRVVFVAKLRSRLSFIKSFCAKHPSSLLPKYIITPNIGANGKHLIKNHTFLLTYIVYK